MGDFVPTYFLLIPLTLYKDIMHGFYKTKNKKTCIWLKSEYIVVPLKNFGRIFGD